NFYVMAGAGAPSEDMLIDFPSPGETDLKEILKEISIPFAEIDLHLDFGRTGKFFRVNNVGPNDTLVLNYLPSSIILGNLFHATPQSNCYVQCPDGRTSQNCITCLVEGHKIKICC